MKGCGSFATNHRLLRAVSKLFVFCRQSVVINYLHRLRLSALAPNLYNHAEVYLKQLTDVSNFSKTTELFRQNIIGSFANYLLNAEAKQYNNVQDLVDKFNNGNKQGYFLSLILSSINNTTGDPTLFKANIFQNNKLIAAINYKEITDDD